LASAAAAAAAAAAVGDAAYKAIEKEREMAVVSRR